MSVAPPPSLAPPPLSPGLFAGLLLRPLPPALLNPLLAAGLSRALARHPKLLSRLPEGYGGDVLITITDLQMSVLLHLAPPGASLSVATEATRQSAVAGISGPLQVLIDLLEGRVDGDALFFSRALKFDGDTEIVVALRNALDGVDLSVADFLPLPAPLSAARPRITQLMSKVHDLATRDLELIRQAAMAGPERTARRQQRKIQNLEDRVGELERKLARSKRKAEAS